MLTSKEIIERTGISRATLNNYIASGLVPRPQVLPPGPQHGAAPRIGYFPDDTIARVEAIQRLKREGWSISRIAEHFAANPPGQPVAGAARPVAAPTAAPTVQAVAPAPHPAAPVQAFQGATSLGLTLEDVGHPAYLVDHDFRIVWANDEARISALSPLTDRPGGKTGNIFGWLLQLPDGAARQAILHLHLQLAQERAAGMGALLRDLPPDQASRLETLYRGAQRPQPGLVSQARIPASGATPARRLYAIRFREGVLFAYVAGELAEDTTPLLRRRPVPAAPVLTPVAVLVTSLQDAAGLWVRLTAPEYFELLNDIWAELDRIFRLHHGRARPQNGESLACYFLPQAEGSYLWNALAAAQQTREAMRQVSQRWQARKGWDLELCMNTGIDDGQDWLGALGTGPDADLVLGDAPDRAEQLARCSRQGAVLVTRSLLGKLPAPEARRLKYAVPRFDAPGAEGRLRSTFARLGDVAGAAGVPARFADVAVAELLDLDLPNPTFTSAPGDQG